MDKRHRLLPILLLLLQALQLCAANLYASHKQVLELTDKSFPLPKDQVYVVKFYAPWCGHCQNLVPEYAKAAAALQNQGVTLAAIDVTKYESVAQQFGIKGFPDIRIFAGGKSPSSYNGERKASAIASAALNELRKHVLAKLGESEPKSKSSSSAESAVLEVDDSSFDAKVLGSSEMWMVEFYAPWCGHCKNLAPHWAEAAEQLKGSGINFAAVDATANSELSSRFSVQGFPTIKMFPPGGSKKDSDAIEYDGPRTTEGIVSWAEAKFQDLGGKIEIEIPELISQEVFDSTCRNKQRCAIVFLPDIRDSGKEGRQNYLQTLKKAQLKSRHVPFLWVAQNNQPALEQLYNLAFGFPALVYLRMSGDKEVGFVYQGKFEEASLGIFLTTGKNMQKAIGTKWPAIVKTEPWDFSEPPPLDAEDDEFDLDEFLSDDK